MHVKALIARDADSLTMAQSRALEWDLPLLRADGPRLQRESRLLKWLKEQFAEPEGFYFVLDHTGLQLARLEHSEWLCIRSDFIGPAVTYRRKQGGGRAEAIARAVGLSGDRLPWVLDATAGLGRDAFVLASLGCRVTLLERQPEVQALLSDALCRARQYAESHDAEFARVIERMELIPEDAHSWLTQSAPNRTPEVIYLDPMFPPRRKSALVKKEMRVFHALVGVDTNGAELLSICLARATRRVVVKRPRLAEPLGAVPPAHSLEGRRNRYDIYPTQPES